MSLDQPTPDGAVTMGDLLGHQDDELGRVDTFTSLRSAIRQLPPRSPAAVPAVHRGTHQADIGIQIEISQMPVSRRLIAILADLRRATRRRILPVGAEVARAGATAACAGDVAALRIRLPQYGAPPRAR